MKTIKSVIPKMLGFFLILTVICGVVFPLVVTGIAKVFSRNRPRDPFWSGRMERNTEVSCWASSSQKTSIYGDVS